MDKEKHAKGTQAWNFFLTFFAETETLQYGPKRGWAKLVLIALERYSVALKRLTFNLR